MPVRGGHGWTVNPMKKLRLTDSTAFRFLVSCIASFSVLAVCSKSSFLYPMNDWVDVNCFFTVGRGILHGLAPYRDLYDQKGPLVYFVYALASLISENSFLGVFLLEGAFYACFLYLGGRIAETLSGLKEAWWLSVPLLAILVPVTPAFSHGSSAEEFFLPVFALGLLIPLRAMHEKRSLRGREGFLLGLCAAAALWSKYTFTGLFLGLALAVTAWYCFTGKAWQLPRLIGFFLLGCAALSGLVVLWFALKGALADLWQAYFMDNLTQYSRNIRGGAYDAPLPNLLNNLPWSVPGVLGILWLAATAKKRGWEALAAALGAVCLFVFTYLSGRRYPYYALVLCVFAPLGMAAACSPARRIKGSWTGAAALAVSVLLLAVNPWIALQASGNTYLMKVPKEDMPQYRFAEIIRQGEDRSLLNYGFLDGGFYFASESLPAQKYFCTLNNDLAEMNEAHRESIREGKTAFIVTRSRGLKDSANYELVDEASMRFEGRNWEYYLYRRTDR